MTVCNFPSMRWQPARNGDTAPNTSPSTTWARTQPCSQSAPMPNLHEAQLKVESVAASIAAGNFDPKPSFNCRFCAYRSLCPATEKRLYTINSATKPN